MFKIAVCFSGQARYITENFEQLKKNLIDPLNADVFFHFWKNSLCDTTGRENQGRYDFDWENAEILYKPKKFILEEHPDITIFRLVDKYMGKVFKFLTPKDFWLNRGSLFRTFSQSYSINYVNKLKKQYEENENFIYDYVVRIRSDFVFPRPLELNDLPKKTNQIVILLEHKNQIFTDVEIPARENMTDSFAITNSKDMDLYADAFNLIPDMIIQKKIITCGEVLCGINAVKHGFKLIYSDICEYRSFYVPPLELISNKVSQPYYPTKEEIGRINSLAMEMYPELFKGSVMDMENK